MEGEKILVQLYEKSVKHHKELCCILARLTKKEMGYLEDKYTHDMKRSFDISELRFKIREATDRLYHLDKLIDEHTNTAAHPDVSRAAQEDRSTDTHDTCSHDIVTDTIDVALDRSMNIRYCSKCEKTFH